MAYTAKHGEHTHPRLTITLCFLPFIGVNLEGMKRIFTILLAFVYLVASGGFAIHIHYCMDEFSGLSLTDSKDKRCDKCGMKKGAKACCKDEVKLVRVADAHKTVNQDFLFHPGFVILKTFSTIQHTDLSSGEEYHDDHLHSPPLNRVPLRILFCDFRV